MRLSVHHCDEGKWPVNERPVDDDMLAASQTNRRSRCFRQPMVDDAVELRHAMAALTGQLSGGVPLHHPAPKPLPLIGLSGRWVTPGERASALLAEPPLSAIGILTVSLEASSQTVRTVFF